MTAIMVAMAAPPASAAGLGGGGSGAVLGQWLDFAVQVRLDAADDLAQECVNAEVTVGERRLPPSLVRTVLEAQGVGSARIRVLTTQSIDEPVVGVNLSVGCQAPRLSRSYVVLADPPETARTVRTASMALAAFAAVESAPALARAPADAEMAVALQPPASAPTRAATPLPDRGSGALGDVAASSTASAPVPARRAAPRAAPLAAPRTAARPERGARQRPAAARPRVTTPQPPRLKLEVAETPASVEAAAVEMALEAVAQATSAIRASAAAASATAARMATLESTVQRLGKEAQSSRDEAAQLREQLSRATGAGRWTLPLLALVVLLAALTAWLAWRLSGLQRQRQRGWMGATAQPVDADHRIEPTPSRPATTPIPFVTSAGHLPASAPAGSRAHGAAAWPPAAPPETSTPGVSPQPPEPVEWPRDAATTRAGMLTPAGQLGDTSPRDVSVDELIDLEQQAEFFVVLGQDEAAIDLLVQHLRDTGGGSPLPYLKLLEIQHHRGDRDAYERTRARFNHRFNAYAPEWGEDMGAGRNLEDYPGVLPRLQQVWARPLDAMAELEALLLRKSRGELFDLPAYREVLFLYALARDLLDRERVDPNNVDLLLPLADGSEVSAAASAPLRGQERGGAATRPGSDDWPTAPVDLDLTQAAPAASIFDPQDRPPPGSRP